MSNLIERLRLFEASGPAIPSCQLFGEAADEIERLRAENDHVTLLYNASLKSQDKQQAALKEAAKSLAENEQEIERLREAIDHRNYLLEQACKESAKLQAALESIARNTCCEGCQEARRVALAALGVGDA